MGEAKTTGKPEPDRLAVAMQTKRRELVLDGQTMTVVRWNLKTSCLAMAKLGEVINVVISQNRGSIDVKNFLAQDLGQLVETHYDSIVEVLSLTIQRDNFESVEEATAWVEELGLADAVRLFATIVEQNLRPLVEAAQEIAAKVRNVVQAEAARKASPQST